jgi:hypothetical protein
MIILYPTFGKKHIELWSKSLKKIEQQNSTNSMFIYDFITYRDILEYIYFELARKSIFANLQI